MPLNKNCSLKAFRENMKILSEEGYVSSQAFAIAMNTLKKACGVASDVKMTPDEVVAAKTEEAFGLAGTPKVFSPYRTGLASHVWPNLSEKGAAKSGWEQDGISMKGKLPKSPRYIPIDKLFEGLPSSPVVRGISFTIAPGIHRVGTSPSASPVQNVIGAVSPDADSRICSECGKGEVTKGNRCPVCGAPYKPTRE